MLFVTSLASQNLSHTTIKVYLSAIRQMHIAIAEHIHFTSALTPRFQQVIKGIQKCQAVSQPPRVRRPITLPLMHGILNVLLKQPPSYYNAMIWAACCIAFFGFLHSSEFTLPSQQQYDLSTHLSITDIAIDSKLSPQLVQIRIKQSKTDPFRQGVNICLGKTGQRVCPVTAILPYLAERGSSVCSLANILVQL